MTPLEMRLHFHLASAICFSNIDGGLVREHLDAAEALIVEAEKALKTEEPPPQVVWCLREVEGTQRRYYGTDAKNPGCFAFFKEYDPGIMRFPDMQTALRHAHQINLWRILEAVPLSSPVTELENQLKGTQHASTVKP